ncbi:MAG: hypothetical protein O2988_11135 [Proteobacteria bacterium]|nr:hypothetical protein [Pseudomonadota bacterium]
MRGATGPVTDAGKAVSSQNARKHGLNAPPEEAIVSKWFNVILNKRGDDQEEPSEADPRREAALRLAIAEARYHRALHKVDTHESEPGSSHQLAMKLRQEFWDVLAGMPKKIADGPPDPHALAYANFAIKQLEELFAQISRERQLYERYLGEARAQRAKALRDWCAFNRNENRNSQNELNLQLRGEHCS